MKKLLPILLVLLLAFAACKNERATVPNTTTTTKIDTTAGQQSTTPVSITGVSPSNGTSGTVVTLTGTNFGTSTTGISVLFNGKAGTVQSVMATEIKVVVPVTTTGLITLTVGSQTIAGPQFTYLSPILTAPYVSGDVTLTTQAAVDAFVAINKGRKLQISGDLSIVGDDITSVSGLSNITSVSGKIFFFNDNALTDAPFLNTITTVGDIYVEFSGFTSLSFNNLNSFSGKIYFQGLSKLSRVSFSGLTTSKGVLISSCPLLTDLSFLSNIKSTDGISIDNIGATKITMDNLVTTGGIYIAACQNLGTISFTSLTNITGTSISSLNITICPSLSSLNFSSLTLIAGKLTLSTTNLTDLDGFNSLKDLGSLTVYNNPALINFHGLESLTTFSSPAIGIGLSNDLKTRLGGIYINGNVKLTSLTGLQNVTTVPIININGNDGLGNFCSLKTPITTLSTLADYSYKYTPSCCDLPIGYTRATSIPALTLVTNSNYKTTPDALAAVALCK